jgi:chromosome segregation protein
MLGFTHLTIRGFKSFADTTELAIAPGLTGIIGPNGCGKSNILEALRWVMGEASAKKMRASEMDDVIFAGTRARPGRDIARVTLALDNTTRAAPAPWTEADTIEITRSIARGKGSDFRINGRPVRARDVQVLFADSISGARSPALVSQGHIAGVMTAKPAERRAFLEDAAGISGLHARRAEAAQRLNAARANLERLAERLADMQGRADALARQARAAMRYRKLSAEIRALEVAGVLAQWRDLEARTTAATDDLAACERDLAARSREATNLAQARDAATVQVEALREQEAHAATALQQAQATQHALDAATARHAREVEAAQLAAEQTEADLQHARAALAEAEGGLADLARHAAPDADATDAELEALATARARAAQELTQATTQHEAALAAAAETRAAQQALARRAEEDRAQYAGLEAQHARAAADLETAAAPARDVGALEAEIAAQERALATAAEQVGALADQIAQRRARLSETRAAGTEAERACVALRCEVEALAALVGPEPDDNTARTGGVVHALTVAPGMEAALAAGLGPGLAAGLSPDGPAFWDIAAGGLGAGALPDGLTPLAQHVEGAPPALTRAVEAVGVALDAHTAEAAASHLKPGQCCVTPDGALWRWDGYRARAGAGEAQAHAAHLRHKNRMAELRADLPAKEQAHRAAEAASARAAAALREAEAAAQALTAARARTEHTLAQARAALSEAQAAAARRAQAVQALEALEAQRAALAGRLETHTEAMEAATQAASTAQEALTTAQDTLAQARAAHNAAQAAENARAQEVTARRARAQAAADERVRLQNQAIRMRGRIADMEGRAAQQAQALDALAAAPPDAPEARATAQVAVDKARTAVEAARGEREAAAREVQQHAQALQAVEAAIGDVRERRAVAAATRASLTEQSQALEATIARRFSCTPAQLAARADNALPQGTAADLAEQCSARVRQRDALGPVNLRADVEKGALDAEIAAQRAEETDLTQATAELQTAIRRLNSEARGRLLTAFEQVDAHFQALFMRLFGGGRAHLSLTAADDPLDAGLEVFAQPPGKTLQSLSLLSGGEQTLAAIALILAMFLTSPAPLCVLDEIDAALDDANVARVCDVLEEIARRGATRFIVITHHRLTMARMDRLYGVTMAEQGVSALVGVDLQESFAFMDAA